MSRKQMYIVGNGPVEGDLSQRIDASDFVVRFNEPKASIGMSGTKTDILFLCNAGKPMERRLGDEAFLGSAIVRKAREVILTYHPVVIEAHFRKPNPLSRLKGRRADWTMATIMALGTRGKACVVMPESFYDDGCNEIGLPITKRDTVFPSTGYFGIFHVLRTFDVTEWDIAVVGFSWQGWRRHAWADEQSWVADKVDRGLLTVPGQPDHQQPEHKTE